MSFLQPRSFCCRDLCSVAKAASSEPPSLHNQWEKPPRFAPCQAPVLPGSCSQAPFGKLWRLGWVFFMPIQGSVDARGLEKPGKAMRHREALLGVHTPFATPPDESWSAKLIHRVRRKESQSLICFFSLF